MHLSRVPLVSIGTGETRLRRKRVNDQADVAAGSISLIQSDLLPNATSAAWHVL